MKDSFGRTIDYLRISVTDKCNLRCRYCMPKGGVELMAHDELLSLEEIYRIVKIMSGMGLKKVRITGGEPLVRRNLVKLIADIRSIPDIEQIGMTTNGILLHGKVKELKEAGLSGVNISLDTLDEKTFTDITGYDGLSSVKASIEEALEAGLKCKLNCVPCREFNEKDIEALAEYAHYKDIDVRFIELMPVGCGRDFHGIPTDEIIQRLRLKFGEPRDVCKKRGNGPASYLEFEGFKGKIGFISPISHKFCGECNRVRLTAKGELKLCLNYNYGVELKPLLKSGAGDREIENALNEALQKKPYEHDFENIKNEKDSENNNFDKRKMVQIGG